MGRRTLTGLLPEGATSGLQVVGNRRGRDGLAKRSATPSTRTHPKPGASFRVSCSFAGRATHVTFREWLLLLKQKTEKPESFSPHRPPSPRTWAFRPHSLHPAPLLSPGS